MQSEAPGIPCRRGKVRDIYDLGDRLVLVATDRISAFDWVLPTGIPDKGRILTEMSLFWLDFLGIPNHLLSANLEDMPEPFRANPEMFRGRSCLVKKTQVVPIECVVRGYLAGSGWKEYQQTGSVCGIPLPPGLKQSQKLLHPIFTPATKAESGHDENISFEEMSRRVGVPLAATLREKTMDIYVRAAGHCEGRGIVLADTKLEWGQDHDGTLLLIDEVLTPDSSRFWARDEYREGSSPPSFDKQFVRDWLETTGWDKNSRPPELPDDVVRSTRQKYLEAFDRLTRSDV
jgi:phosphoribosylaminoimidazole-succinocarboxamide synthase